MPAKSRSQQKLFGMALAIRKGKLERDGIGKEVLDIVDSDMSDKDIEDFASTKHKGLKEYVKESLLDDEELLIKNTKEETIKNEIYKFIEQVYGKFNYEIRKSSTNDKFIIDSNCSIVVKDKNIKSLTNDLFVWGNVKEFTICRCNLLTSLEGSPNKVSNNFSCCFCKSLTSLEGSPKEVGGDFECYENKSLISLEGTPEKIGRDFDCSDCGSLKSLKGSPKEIGGDFNCSNCESLITLEGAPEKIMGGFDCSNCESLTSFKGIPQIINGTFDCNGCKMLKSLDYFPKKIKDRLYIKRIGIKNLTYRQIKLISDVRGEIFK